jgi:hypothetical protein
VAGDKAELTGATDTAGSSTTIVERAAAVGRRWQGSDRARRARGRVRGFGRVQIQCVTLILGQPIHP